MKRKSIYHVIVLVVILIIITPRVFAAGAENRTGTDNDVLKTSAPEAVGVTYRTHIQNIGWESTWAADGNPAGTEGQSLRLEGLQIKLTGENLPDGAQIEYRTHVQDSGWESDWTQNGGTAGTVGQSLRLEAIEIRLLKLPGYSVQYRVHVQNNGWETAWAADGERAGTEGQSLRLEAIEIRLVKVVPAPDGVAAKAASHGISLTWNSVAGADSYTVDQATSIDGDYTEAVTGITATNYTVPNLEDGKRYYYKVKATAGSADSPLSDAVTAIASVDDQGTVLLGNRLLISNESTDIEKTQSTGTLSSAAAAMETAQLDSVPFGIDRILPFEPAAGQKPIDPTDPAVLGTSDVYEVNSTKDFYTYNFDTGNTDITHARLAYIGTHVQIWIDAKDPKMVMTDEDARVMAAEFDNQMYPLVTENFYTESDVNNDGKIAILCYDIQDGYTGVRPNTNYTCGYFAPGDLFDSANSNKMEVFYADTYPSIKKNGDTTDMTQIYGTLVHEFQHMVNFNAMGLIGDSGDTDLWLNEAFSLAAEEMYSGSAPFGGTGKSFASLYVGIYNTNDAIRNGRSLLKFDTSDDPSYSNYILSYFFSQYLRTQVDAALGTGNSVKVFKEIMADPGTRTAAVEHVMQKYVDPNLTFGDILTNFRAAMVVRADTGVFGFNGEAVFDELSTPLYTGGNTNLLGGGAIVTAIDVPFTVPADQGADVSCLGFFR